MKEYTKWFPVEIKPVREGVYQVFNSHTYAYWNGKRWGWAALSVATATTDKAIAGASQDKLWRGLTKQEVVK